MRHSEKLAPRAQDVERSKHARRHAAGERGRDRLFRQLEGMGTQVLGKNHARHAGTVYPQPEDLRQLCGVRIAYHSARRMQPDRFVIIH